VRRLLTLPLAVSVLLGLTPLGARASTEPGPTGTVTAVVVADCAGIHVTNGTAPVTVRDALGITIWEGRPPAHLAVVPGDYSAVVATTGGNKPVALTVPEPCVAFALPATDIGTPPCTEPQPAEDGSVVPCGYWDDVVTTVLPLATQAPAPAGTLPSTGSGQRAAVVGLLAAVLLLLGSGLVALARRRL